MLALALAETSGTMRPASWPGLTGAMSSPDCQAGRAMRALTPPPVEPPLSARRPSPSFHARSLRLAPVRSSVPPTASTNGLEHGKSTCALPSLMPSDEPSSPAATQMVIPISAASCSASFTCVTAEAVHTETSSA